MKTRTTNQIRFAVAVALTVLFAQAFAFAAPETAKKEAKTKNTENIVSYARGEVKKKFTDFSFFIRLPKAETIKELEAAKIKVKKDTEFHDASKMVYIVVCSEKQDRKTALKIIKGKADEVTKGTK